MLNGREGDSPLGDREVQLVEENRQLKNALTSTLFYIQTRFQSVLPPELKDYEQLLQEIQPDDFVSLNAPRDFFDAVTAMARFLNLTSTARVFEEFGVSGFADWTILMALGFEPQGMSERQLLVTIGMSVKRLQRLSGRLVQVGLVEVVEQSNVPTFSITPSGEKMLETMNASLQAALALFPRRHELYYASRKVRLITRMYDGMQPRKKRRP